MKKRLNKLAARLITLAMLMTFIPCFTFTALAADGTFVAKVGDVEYTDFATAVANWTDNTTLTLLDDVTGLTEQIQLSGNGLVLDLNGKSMTSTISNTLSVTGGELTIRDNVGTGSFTTTGYTVLLVNEDNAVVNFESGTLQGVRVNRGTFNMTGGKIYSETWTGIDYSDSGTVNVSGGEVTSTSWGAIYNNYGTLTVTGTAKITSTNGYAISNFRDSNLTTISGDVVLSGSKGEFDLGKKIVLNTQPSDGTTWDVKIHTDVNTGITGGVFATPGEGVTLDPANFASAMDGYEVKKNDKGELLLCNHQTAYAAVSNEDGSTHKMLCCCRETTVEASVACSGFGATCQTKAVCAACGQSYGETNPDAHTFNDDGKCACGAERGEAVNIDLSTLTATYVISDSGEYIFTGTGSYGIKVESGNPTIVLNNASITVGEGSAIDIASGSTTAIQVLGDNTIGTTKTESWDAPCGGIFVAEGGTVNITSNGTDNILRAHGTLAAAIGGKYDYDNNESYNAGSINISNVTVYAYTNNFYAAAIGAAGEGTCGTINITNAVVYVYGAGDRWTSAPGIGSAWGLVGWPETIPVVIISDSEVHTFRHNSGSDYIGYLGDVELPTNATGSINCGEGGSVTNSIIYCYTGLDATTTDKVVKYGALGGLLKEDGTCEGEHSFDGYICDNCGYCSCTHEGGTATCAAKAVCDVCGNEYGSKDTNNHDSSIEYVNGICPNGCVELLVGDANVDGKIDVADVITLRKYIVGGYGVVVNERNANVNKDEKVDIRDVMVLRRYVTGGYGIVLK